MTWEYEIRWEWYFTAAENAEGSILNLLLLGMGKAAHLRNINREILTLLRPEGSERVSPNLYDSLVFRDLAFLVFMLKVQLIMK